MYTTAESTETIDSYARTPGGPPWGTMREAWNLPEAVQTTPGQEESGFQSDAANRRLRALSDAAAVVSIERDTEAQETPASITSLWKLLAYPQADGAHQGSNVARGYFSRIIRAGLWMPHGEKYNGAASYFPKIVRDGDMGEVRGEEFEVGGHTLPEVANTHAIERYAGSAARWDNALIIRDFA